MFVTLQGNFTANATLLSEWACESQAGNPMTILCQSGLLTFGQGYPVFGVGRPQDYRQIFMSFQHCIGSELVFSNLITNAIVEPNFVYFKEIIRRYYEMQFEWTGAIMYQRFYAFPFGTLLQVYF